MQGEGAAAYACAVDLTDFTDPDVTVEVVGSELTIRIGLPADANVDRLRAHLEPGRLANSSSCRCSSSPERSSAWLRCRGGSRC